MTPRRRAPDSPPDTLRPPVEPMLATPVDHLPEGGGWCYEPKWDGWRCIGFHQAGRIYLQSRTGKPMSSYFPEVARAIRDQLPVGTVVDGELIIWDQVRGRTSFADLQRRITAGPRAVRMARDHPAHYVIFDLLADSTGVLLTVPLARRRARLERLLEGAPLALPLCAQTTDLNQAREWMRAWTAAGVEGIVAKRLNGRYEPGRRRWCKLRAKATTEAIIGGVTGTVSAPETLLLGRYDLAGRLRYVGRTHALTSIQKREVALVLTRSPQRRNGGVDHPWPQPLPPSWTGQLERSAPLPYVQVEPETVIEIKVDTAYENTRWRHRVQAVRCRADLSVYDVPLSTRDAL